MNDDEIIDALRAAHPARRPHELAILLGELRAEPVSQGSVATYFKRAFPSIPLRVLLEAGAWHRVSAGHMSDADFDALIGPFLKLP